MASRASKLRGIAIWVAKEDKLTKYKKTDLENINKEQKHHWRKKMEESKKRKNQQQKVKQLKYE